MCGIADHRCTSVVGDTEEDTNCCSIIHHNYILIIYLLRTRSHDTYAHQSNTVYIIIYYIYYISILLRLEDDVEHEIKR